MKKRKKIIKAESKKHKFDILLPIIFVLSFINPIRAAISQYYILQYPDDIVWVSWAHNHFNQPLHILLDKQGTGFRPMINLIYAIGYSLWGANEALYYLMNGLLFSGSMIFLYLLIKQLHSRLAGVIAVSLYILMDASFILVWKMNYTTSIAEIFFITSSLYYSIHFFEKADKKSLFLCSILTIFAFLSKEPSILIIPTVNILYIVHKWKFIGIRTRTAAIILNLFIPILFLILAFKISTEVGVPRTSFLLDLIKSRIVTYIDYEFSDSYGQLKNIYLLFLACIGSVSFHKFKREEYGGRKIESIKRIVSILSIFILFILFNLFSLFSIIGYILIFIFLTIGFLFGDISKRLGIAWFGIAILPLLVTSQSEQPTYLAEPNLGLSIFLGVTISEYLKNIFHEFHEHDYSILKIVNSGMIVLILLLQLPGVFTEIQNTNNYHKMISDNQKSFKEAVDYLKINVPKNGTVYYISTEEREKVKGGQIDAEVFQWLLCDKGRCDIDVKSLSSLDKANGEKTGEYVALLSNLDIYIFVNNYKNLISSDMFSSQKEIKDGDNVAYILGLK